MAKSDELTSVTETPVTLPNLGAHTIQAAKNDQAAEAARVELTRLEAEREEEEGPLTSLNEVDVLVFRNEFASIPATVFEHELPILRVLHGDDMVKVTGEYTVEVENFDANEELARLQRKYNSKEGDPVGAVYGNDPRRLAKEAGVAYTSGRAEKPARSEQSGSARPASRTTSKAKTASKSAKGKR